MPAPGRFYCFGGANSRAVGARTLAASRRRWATCPGKVGRFSVEPATRCRPTHSSRCAPCRQLPVFLACQVRTQLSAAARHTACAAPRDGGGKPWRRRPARPRGRRGPGRGRGEESGGRPPAAGRRATGRREVRRRRAATHARAGARTHTHTHVRALRGAPALPHALTPVTPLIPPPPLGTAC